MLIIKAAAIWVAALSLFDWYFYKGVHIAFVAEVGRVAWRFVT